MLSTVLVDSISGDTHALAYGLYSSAFRHCERGLARFRVRDWLCGMDAHSPGKSTSDCVHGEPLLIDVAAQRKIGFSSLAADIGGVLTL